jgi:hypothetical protein
MYQESYVEDRFHLNRLFDAEPVAEHDGELGHGGGLAHHNYSGSQHVAIRSSKCLIDTGADLDLPLDLTKSTFRKPGAVRFPTKSLCGKRHQISGALTNKGQTPTRDSNLIDECVQEQFSCL